MASALIGGLCGTVSQPEDIHVVDVSPVCLSQLTERFGIKTSNQIDAQIAECDVVLLAVKPQQMREVAEQLVPYLKGQLIISIAAGIRALDLSRWLNGYPQIVRTMPNMPALINQGITGMYAMPVVSAEQRTIANAIMSAVGATVWLDNEALLDPLTAISGSGPAYVFYFIEAMQKAAQEMGLDQEQGRQLALATFLGASQLAAQSSEPAAVLRERVTSKGGTTYAALTSMEQSGVSNAIVTALKAAAERSSELGDEFGSEPSR
ncbi:proC: pyrroline-5-carboxylate reductase [Solimicrobium silvestre]|uniref:Pyrroline-5-carboxylate reductase n=2 Tax=Solimicrobium silvestre TaxID=2099400 RepID=A0A2S9H362_9BURK|nr:proC: pyrroline-5-carboxylate reductase [Solimicrobium silvestre]